MTKSDKKALTIALVLIGVFFTLVIVIGVLLQMELAVSEPPCLNADLELCKRL